MAKPPKSKKKAAAAAKKKEMEELALQEQAAVEDEYEFQKICLEIRIKELETLNLGLQRKSEYLVSQNDVYKVQLDDLREEKDDLVSHLERCYRGEKTIAKELEDRLYGTHSAMVEEKQAYEKKLEDKDKNLEEVETELKRTIFELESKLMGLEEFRIQKEKLTAQREELQRTLEEERGRFVRNYDELENNLIRYRERVKNESIEMIQKMAKDIQRAGKLCLTVTVKSAISENIRLQDDLEQCSKVNLTLREKIEKLEKSQRDGKMSSKVFEVENSVLHKKCCQFRSMTQELIDRQVLLQEQLESNSEMEKELINLKAEHAVCLSEEDIKKQVADELEKVLGNEGQRHDGENSIPKSRTMQVSISDPKDVEIFELRNLVQQLAKAATSLSKAPGSREMQQELQKQEFNRLLRNIVEIASEIQILSPDTCIPKQLGVDGDISSSDSSD